MAKAVSAPAVARCGDDDEEEEEEDVYLEKGYEVSGRSVLEGEVCSKVVGHVIGVATWQRCTYGAYLEDRKGEWTPLICAHLAAHRLLFFFFCICFTVPGPSAKNTALTTGPLLSSGQPESTLSRSQPQFLSL